MDILIEILLEVYMELMFLIVPEDKRRKKHRIIAMVVAIVMTFGLMALAFWGVCLIAEQKKKLGLIPLIIAIVLSLAQIVSGILLYNYRQKRNKKK